MWIELTLLFHSGVFLKFHTSHTLLQGGIQIHLQQHHQSHATIRLTGHSTNHHSCMILFVVNGYAFLCIHQVKRAWYPCNIFVVDVDVVNQRMNGFVQNVRREIHNHIISLNVEMLNIVKLFCLFQLRLKTLYALKTSMHL